LGRGGAVAAGRQAVAGRAGEVAALALLVARGFAAHAVDARLAFAALVVLRARRARAAFVLALPLRHAGGDRAPALRVTLLRRVHGGALGRGVAVARQLAELLGGAARAR